MSYLIKLLAAGVAVTFATQAAAQGTSCTGRASDTKLYVDVEGVRSSKGLIAVTLYADDPSKFLVTRGSLYVGRTDAKAGTTRVCIHLPKPGVYVLGVYHDEDGDRSIDRSAIGLPTEGVGFSNNPKLVLSIPSFRSVRLSVPKTNLKTRVTLRYP